MGWVKLADPDWTIHGVEVDARDRRAAEVKLPALLKVKGLSMRQLLGAFPETWQAWTSWHAAVRQGLTSVPWEEWQARFLEQELPEGAEAEEEEDLPDPTNPGRSPGS